MTSLAVLVNSVEVNSTEFESLVDDLMIDNNDVPFDDREVRRGYLVIFFLNVL